MRKGREAEAGKIKPATDQANQTQGEVVPPGKTSRLPGLSEEGALGPKSPTEKSPPLLWKPGQEFVK